MTDFRVDSSWRTHPKRKKLLRRVGPGAVLALEDLWSFCADNRSDGRLTELELDDLELLVEEARPEVSTAELIDAWVGLRLLEHGEDGVLQVHDWADWQPFVVSGPLREAASKAAALTRWHKDGKHSIPHPGCPKCEAHAEGMRPACDPHAEGNAPTPNPIPIPSPTNSGTAERNELPGQLGKLAGSGTEGEVGFDTLDAAMKHDWPKRRRGRATEGIPDRWRGRLREMSPFTRAEVKRALGEALSFERPNGGLICSKLIAARESREEGPTGPPLPAQRVGEIPDFARRAVERFAGGTG